jgi:hypothetical protein
MEYALSLVLAAVVLVRQPAFGTKILVFEPCVAVRSESQTVSCNIERKTRFAFDGFRMLM